MDEHCVRLAGIANIFGLLRMSGRLNEISYLMRDIYRSSTDSKHIRLPVLLFSLAQETCGNTGYHRIWLHIVRDHRTRCDYTTRTNANTSNDDRICPDPHIVFYHNFLLLRRSVYEGYLRIFVRVPNRGEHRVGGHSTLVADFEWTIKNTERSEVCHASNRYTGTHLNVYTDIEQGVVADRQALGIEYRDSCSELNIITDML